MTFLSHIRPFWCTLLLLLCVSNTVQAHEISSGYLTLEAQGNNQWQGELALKPVDLEQAFPIDANGDGKLMWGEVLTAQQHLVEFASAHLLAKQQDPCTFSYRQAKLSNLSGQNLIALPFDLTCTGNTELTLHYDGMFDYDASHKVLVTIDNEDSTFTDVLTTTHRDTQLNGNSSSVSDTIYTFVYQGIVHILIGTDHILFLIATLLTVNLCRKRKLWEGQESKRAVLKETLILVTAFTLAHSLTLTATALGWVEPNGHWVELLIAISVLLTALNNLFPVVHRLGWITFGFGLIHGMGFASVFAELHAATSNTVIAVGAFNVGVEIGQLAIVLTLMPFLLLFRHVRWYAQTAMPILSSVIAIVAMNWALQRF